MRHAILVMGNSNDRLTAAAMRTHIAELRAGPHKPKIRALCTRLWDEASVREFDPTVIHVVVRDVPDPGLVDFASSIDVKIETVGAEDPEPEPEPVDPEEAAREEALLAKRAAEENDVQTESDPASAPAPVVAQAAADATPPKRRRGRPRKVK